ncbi:MAG: hypothetical protein R3309_01040 [Reinekea sp.]|jgi:hypothetical protein|nr:hypothetical protein [Reinekea sp.]
MRFIVSLISLFLLLGCSSAPLKTTAIHQALVTDSAIRQAVEHCVDLGVEESRLAMREQQNWWLRNNTLVLAADYGVLELNWEQVPDEAESQRAVLAIQTLERIQLDANDQVERWFGDYDETDDCRKVFGNVAKGRLDLARDKKLADELTAIAQRRQSVSNDAESARSINTRYRKYGRSLFVVEKVLREAGCSKPNVALLRNSWPLEVYDAVCTPQDYLLVKCEWGRCDVKR